MKCEREQQIIEATRSGLWTSSLRAHLQDCAHCADTVLIADSLREDAAEMVRVADLPPAGMVWRRAQARMRGHALQRATRRPFLIVSALGAVYALVLVVWGISQVPLSFHRLLVAPPGSAGNVALAGAVLSAILAIVGSCVLGIGIRR